jgi:DNA ligase (NAD+)
MESISRLFTSVFGAPAGDGKTFHPSQPCPECGSKLMRVAGRDKLHESQTDSHAPVKDGDSCNSSFRDENTNWLCPNPDCPAQVRRRLVHWCSPEAMDIPGGGEAFVALLVNRGLVRDVAELYQLKVAEFAHLGRIGEASAKNFVDAIAASKTRDAWRVLYGLGILHVGAGVAQSLARHFPTLDHILDASTDQLAKAGGSSEVIANSVVHWWGDPVNRKLVKRLSKAGLNFKSELYQPALPGGPVAGQMFGV